MTDHAMNVQPNGFRVIPGAEDEWLLLECPDERCLRGIVMKSGSTLGRLLDMAKIHLAGPISE